MRLIILLIAIFAKPALGSLRLERLSGLNMRLIDSEMVAIEVCGFDKDRSPHCRIVKGFSLSLPQDEQMLEFQAFRLDDEGVYSKKMQFGEVSKNGVLKLSADLSCELELLSYSINIKERLKALSLGVFAKGRDDLHLHCRLR